MSEQHKTHLDNPVYESMDVGQSHVQSHYPVDDRTNAPKGFQGNNHQFLVRKKVCGNLEVINLGNSSTLANFHGKEPDTTVPQNMKQSIAL